jgi:hypothetical protein
MNNKWLAYIAALCLGTGALAADSIDKDKKAAPKAAPKVAPKASANSKPTNKGAERGIILQNQGASKGTERGIILQNQGKTKTPDAAKGKVTPGG